MSELTWPQQVRALFAGKDEITLYAGANIYRGVVVDHGSDWVQLHDPNTDEHFWVHHRAVEAVGRE